MRKNNSVVQLLCISSGVLGPLLHQNFNQPTCFWPCLQRQGFCV
jgi:hypothetical protein